MSVDLQTLATAWLEAFAQRDFDRFAGLLEPAVAFRALTPPGLREASDPGGVIGRIRGWFGPSDVFAIRSSGIDLVADRVRITYRVDVHEDGAWLTVDQTLFAAAGDSGFSAIDLLCSGFRPIAPPSDLVANP